MSEKKAINNLVNLINEKYTFRDHDNVRLKIHANPNINGWEIWLYREDTGAVSVHFTQHEQIPEHSALILLKMLFFDILERQDLNHYSVIKRV